MKNRLAGLFHHAAPFHGALIGVVPFHGALIGIALVALAVAPAQAQRSAGFGNTPSAKPAGRAPALPGSKIEKPTPAPAERMASEMNPTAALFDGINRGDLASVKDAISRGAELDARSLLGLTPLELSVDLGHHDISFLLLSMRDSGGGKRPGVAAAKAPAKPALLPKPVRAAVEPSYSPTKFSGDGGAAVPDKGFLGFQPKR